MAQISIPMSNKVGYSMFWNSMWDGKINFSRLLKEDIYLNIFISLILRDKISNKLLKTLDYNNLLKNANLNKYNLHLKIENLKKSLFYKHINELNKTNFFGTKVWILKYQKWIIIYFFIYISKFNDLKKNNLLFNQKKSSNNINDLFILYKKAHLKSKYSYKFFKQNMNKCYF